MANQLFTLITSVWEKAVVTWDAVWAVVWLDVLAAIQGLLAVITVETVSHGSILEKQNSNSQVGNLRGKKTHTEKTGIFTAMFAVNTQLICVMDDKQGRYTWKEVVKNSEKSKRKKTIFLLGFESCVIKASSGQGETVREVVTLLSQ